MKLKSPIRVVLEVTDKCNYCCTHCFNSSSPTICTSQELNTKAWKKILKELSVLEVFEVSFTGGEPFMREDIFELLSYAYKLGFFITLNTNGSLLNDKKIKQLKNIFKKDANLVRIMFSLNTLDIKNFKKITNSSFSPSNIVANMNKLSEEGFNVTMTSIFMKRTIRDYPDLLEYFLKSKVKIWNISAVIPYGRGINHNLFNPSEKDWKSLINFFEKNKKKVEIMGKKISIQANIFNLFSNKEDSTCFNCPAGKTEMSIDSKGNPNPCISFGENSKDDSKKIKHYWDRNNLLYTLRNKNESQLSGPCIKCNFKKYCLGGCPALALRNFNSITMPDPRCPFLPEIINISQDKTFKNFILRLTKENMQGYYPDWKPINKEIEKEFLNKKNKTWLIKKKSLNLGYILFCEEFPNIFIDSIQIKKKYQGEGYGSLVLKKLESYAIKNKFKKIYLKVKKINKLAIRFYENLDYKIEKKEDDNLFLYKNL